ncbi:hypothetical protein BC938DRAFT_475424 [Jimgerdemannia flammicorona]|uniref:Uncharacterized protein n=1 Tax=Jimgerdemannia flammicorona TaxID=994334 RepID=A0A433PV07_9FUNG|nr:hypothetical protein BC938DRAFT_475424 [Jimgerdemannia flammicorona]
MVIEDERDTGIEPPSAPGRCGEWRLECDRLWCCGNAGLYGGEDVAPWKALLYGTPLPECPRIGVGRCSWA